MSPAQKRLFWGAMAVVFYIAHATTWLLRGVPGSLLWACHLGCLMIGIAVLASIPMLNAIGVLWLVLGNLMWGVYLLEGGELIMTSQLTHLGGIFIGVWFARCQGFPRGAWLAALAGIAALHVLSGYVTPPAENINLAFSVHGSLKGIFPDFQVYRFFLLVAIAALFYALEGAARRITASAKKRI